MALGEQEQQILDLIYGLVYPQGTWPTYRTVDLHMDKRLDIGDTQAALLSVSEELLKRPWQVGFYDNDEVRLTLRGVNACQGGRDDLDALASFLGWVCSREAQTPVDPPDFMVTSREYAEALGLDLGPVPDAQPPQPTPPGQQSVSPEAARARETMIHLRVLGMLVPSFWQSAGHSQEGPWDWTFVIDRRRLRRYREVRGGADLLRIEEELEQSAPLAVAPALQPETDTPDVQTILAGDVSTTAEDARVVVPSPRPGYETMLSVLREDVAALCTAAVSQERYDDAIFDAFRHVEAEVQRRTGLPDVIGSRLLQHAFMEEGPRQIKVTHRQGDQQRLYEMFGAAIGLHRGDRAHKDKPALICRTLQECVRLLAHACVLLDLLDRDMAVTPTILGYAQRDDDTLTLRVERATPTTRVLIDERPCPVLRRGLGTITVSTVGIPTDEHDVVLIDGSLQSPSTPIWLVRAAGLGNWYRVEEVNMPLYTNQDCIEPLDVTGVRLVIREAGVEGQRIVATERSYVPGDYVTWGWDTTRTLSRAWARSRSNEPPFVVFDASTLFDGDPTAAAHPARTMRISLEPPLIKARVKEFHPLRALAWKTDGTAAWTEPIDNPKISSDNSSSVSVERQKGMRVNAPGHCTLRLEHEGQYAEAAVEAGAHPRGTVTDWVTALPPVSDIVWTEKTGLLIATREPTIWQIDPSTRKLQPAAGVVPKPPFYGGVETLARAGNGDLAIHLFGEPDLLVLTTNSDLSASYTVSKPEPENSIFAFAWQGTDLIIAMHTQTLWRYTPDGQYALLGRTPHLIKRLAPDPDTGKLLGITVETKRQQICRIDPDQPDAMEELLADPLQTNTLAALAPARSGEIYVTDFHGGRLLCVGPDGSLTTMVAGLKNPNAVGVDGDGTVYVADFADQAVIRRVMP
ncbi:TIGR02391 family protein [Streptomyces sp. NPDC048385]|uniref:TIGR02391 family protein n=2 Tax=unclassified Streptomyces TaxID=2593676 RepID=UPI003415A9FB